LALLAVLQPDARAAARVLSALAGTHKAVVTDHPRRGRAQSEISSIRRMHPTLALIAYADVEHELDYYDLGSLGVDGLLVAGVHDAATIRETIDLALGNAFAAHIAQELEAEFGAIGAQAMAWSVQHAATDPSVAQLARGLGMAPGALAVLLKADDLPVPRTILLWGRLLRAAAYLSRDQRTVEETAFNLGYSTATALARAMKRHTGLTPGAVAARDGLDRVQTALVSGGKQPRRSTRVAAPLLLSALLAGCAALGGGSGGIDRDAVERVLEASPMDQVHFGVLVVDARTGRTLYSRNAHRKFVPASNQKILVTATAISLLGPDFRYETELWATGSLIGTLLDGDLVVLASGDPSMSDRFWPTGEAALAAMADSLVDKGLTHLGGSVFVDVSAWDSATVGPTWEVEDLRFAYGSTGGAFTIDEGEITVVVSAGPAVGSPANVEWWPVGTPDYVRSRIKTVPPDSSTRVRPSYLPESRQLVLEGQVELYATDTLSFAIRDPVRQSVAALGNAIEAAGIEVQGGAEVAWTEGYRVGRGCLSGAVRSCPNAGLVLTMESPPLSELTAQILERSQNWMTEQLIRTLGDELGEQGSWSEGVDVIQDFLTDEVGVDSLDVAARDGSGLSGYNLVTPRALIQILQYMSAGPNAGVYRSALAEPGEEDSTLENRLLDLEDRVWAKTGTISNVNSLSGYLVRDDGTELIFSILSNGSGLPASRVRAAIDDVVRVLAR